LGEIGGACLLLLVIYAFAGWHWYHHHPPKIPVAPKRYADFDARYYKSSRWKTKAKKCKEDANFTCNDCGITQMDLHKQQLGQWLHAHHLTYDRWGGDELPEDLLCLCPDCHNKRHGR